MQICRWTKNERGKWITLQCGPPGAPISEILDFAERAVKLLEESKIHHVSPDWRYWRDALLGECADAPTPPSLRDKVNHILSTNPDWVSAVTLLADEIDALKKRLP